MLCYIAHMYRSATNDDTADVARPTAPYTKWGEALDAGFQVLPDMLVKHQGDLELGPADLVVLINLTMQWWFADRLPFPTTATIARRMGTSPRTVQRSLSRLERMGLLTKARRGQGKSLAFDLTPLSDRLRSYALRDPGYRPRLRAVNGNPASVQTQGSV
jgi:DNA-binding transcriptional ArsR family regulator